MCCVYKRGMKLLGNVSGIQRHVYALVSITFDAEVVVSRLPLPPHPDGRPSRRSAAAWAAATYAIWRYSASQRAAAVFSKAEADDWNVKAKKAADAKAAT